MSGTGYGEKDYWDSRYSSSESDNYEWYLNWEFLRGVLSPYIHGVHTSDALTGTMCRSCLSQAFLIVGCGNSELSAHMFNDGYHNQRSMDYSEVVIEKMRRLYAHTPTLAASYDVGDVRRLAYEDNSFDVVIDKGTLDAILCGSESAKNASMMLSEVHRVLKNGGVFLLLTYGQPSSRLPYLENKRMYSWSVQYDTLAHTKYLYVLKKKI